MSTRSEILVKCSFGQCKLYHHHDGYIEGVGFDLFQRFFSTKEEGFNRKYGTPHIDDIVNTLVKDAKDEYEVTVAKHTDIEYFYEIDVDKKTLTGWQAHYHYDKKENQSILKKDVKYSFDDIKKLYYGENNDR